jgi:hypothetical protein
MTTTAFDAALQREHNAPIERKPTKPVLRRKPLSMLQKYIEEKKAARRIAKTKSVQEARRLDAIARLAQRSSGPAASGLRKASDAADSRGRRPTPPA